MLYPDSLVQQLRADPVVRRQATARARAWDAYSDDDLWQAVFGPSITRSWMVLSDGHCPACGQNVNMYDWRIDPFTHPFKTLCPACDTAFPRNDFAAFYRSGLDEEGLFDPRRADRSLLTDAAGNPAAIGIDDGEGYTDEDRTWRFIGTYLIYGQWKQFIVDGVERLAAAWTATGEASYARRAGLLLDRISDVYPTFDFGAQAVLYERPGDRGYVSTWHDACHEIQRLTLAYHQIRPAIRQDAELVAFLSRKAQEVDLPTLKTSGEQICHNIESRILQDTLDHNEKIESNFPTTQVARILIHATLAEADGVTDQIDELFDDILTRGTAVDGVSGEKGLAGYAAIAPRSIAASLSLFSRVDPAFLPRILERHPRLHEHFRFHIDTWIARRYYPNIGDAGAPGSPAAGFVGPVFDRERQDPLAPSTFTFYWQLYEATGDTAFVHVLLHANDARTDGLPHDPTCGEPETFRRQVAEVISSSDTRLATSVNKSEYHLAILRSEDEGRGPVAWLDYDSGALNSVYAYRLDPEVRGRGAHSHADGMNLGLYYRGLDLMHDFGYPPVNYGGWDSPKAEWAKRTLSHNTVTIDGLDQASSGGRTSWWIPGPHVRGISVSAPGLIDRTEPEGLRFERTILLVPLGRDEAYLVDAIHLVGGCLHQRFLHAGFGTLQTEGLDLQQGLPDPSLAEEPLLRSWSMAPDAARGWTADWQITDHYGVADDVDVHLRYTDLSDDALAATCEGWCLHGYYGERNEEWIRRVLQQRRGDLPLESGFVGVLEPYVGTPRTQSRRLDDGGDTSTCAIEVTIDDGRRDVILLGDPLQSSAAIQADGASLAGQLGCVRFDAEGHPVTATLLGDHLRVDDLWMEHDSPEAATLFFEGRQASGPSGIRVRLQDRPVDIRPEPEQRPEPQ